jgi:hypothetical protein
MVEAYNTAAKADTICVDIEMDSYYLSNWPDLQDNKVTDMLVEKGPVQISCSDSDLKNYDNQHISDNFYDKIAK